jgi:hypothetical protein
MSTSLDCDIDAQLVSASSSVAFSLFLSRNTLGALREFCQMFFQSEPPLRRLIFDPIDVITNCVIR